MKALNISKIQNKLRNKFLKSGVKMNGPETIFFSEDTKIGKNVTIEPYVVIGKNVKIGDSVIIKSFSHLESCKVEIKLRLDHMPEFVQTQFLKKVLRLEIL
jgi:bifunctional N-acetylglucosamine-1-phosphate-uridyltransferase/glucosamine-1-phosphate-acetyltransferase GlmU-like protein